MNNITLLRVCFGDTTDSISLLRLLSEQIVNRTVNSFDRSKLIGAAAFELMDNAIHYAPDHAGIFEIEYDSANKEFILNEINLADKKNFDSLQKILKLIKEDDPENSYHKMMLRSIKDQKKNQLGLAKIHFECNADIEAKIIDKNSYENFIFDNKNSKLFLDNNYIYCIKLTVMTQFNSV